MWLLKSSFFLSVLSFCLSYFSSSLFIGGRPGIIWGLISSFRGLLGMDGVEWIVIIAHRSSKSTFGANYAIIEST